MEIILSQKEDIDVIFELYEAAIAFQKQVGTNSWKGFERVMIEQEIAEKRHFVIKDENQITATFVLTYNDPIIWKEADKDSALYIHRIATNPDFRGQNLVGQIVEWAKIYANENQKQFVRMDTVGDNPGLINYYTKCGFDFLGLLKLKNTTGLPAHYDNATVSLFQMKINRE